MQTTRRARNIQTSQHPCAQSLAGVTNVHARFKSTPGSVRRRSFSGESRLLVSGVVIRETGRQAFHRQLREDRQNANPIPHRVICSIAYQQRRSVCVTSTRTGIRKNVASVQLHVPSQTITARRSRQAVGVAGYNPDHHGHIVPPGNGGPQTQDLHSHPVSRTTKSGNYTRLQSPTAPLDSGFRQNDVRSVGAMWSVVVCLQRGDH